MSWQAIYPGYALQDSSRNFHAASHIAPGKTGLMFLEFARAERHDTHRPACAARLGAAKAPLYVGQTLLTALKFLLVGGWTVIIGRAKRVQSN
jgi:hypothetical protein